MTVTYEVEVDEATDEALAEYTDRQIAEALTGALEKLAEIDSAEAKRDELRERRRTRNRTAGDGSGDVEELTDEEMAEQVRAFLRGERRRDPRLD